DDEPCRQGEPGRAEDRPEDGRVEKQYHEQTREYGDRQEGHPDRSRLLAGVIQRVQVFAQVHLYRCLKWIRFRFRGLTIARCEGGALALPSPDSHGRRADPGESIISPRADATPVSRGVRRLRGAPRSECGSDVRSCPDCRPPRLTSAAMDGILIVDV